MKMGQVWSSADFDGVNPDGFQGGRGSVLAVTAQNRGSDEIWDTADDLAVPLNMVPCPVSHDHQNGNSLDRVRGFNSLHPGGGQFGFGDGSVRFVSETIDTRTYRESSTIAGSEVSGD